MEEYKNLDDSNEQELEDSLIRVSGMYKDWFLDYASYVILERAVPSIEDGFKPVQRRILHSMKDLDDLTISSLARGVPLSSEIEYLDEGTLTHAFQQRKVLDQGI